MNINFAKLWKYHPEINGDKNPCRKKDGSKAFDDQCAIRIGFALAQCGYDITKLKAESCWFHSKCEGHILRAEELANALSRTVIPGIFPVLKITAANFEDALKNQTGIMFFKDYWRRGKESFDNRTGDHIDLWNGSRLTTLSSWFRIQWGLSIEGEFSDFFDSKEIWFWKVL
ncbi:MAG: hypothetical protein GX040_02810 [Alcaligenaceae bacterium]|nr:hypothetical protein [Alcaligenaceae bacterium]